MSLCHMSPLFFLGSWIKTPLSNEYSVVDDNLVVLWSRHSVFVPLFEDFRVQRVGTPHDGSRLRSLHPPVERPEWTLSRPNLNNKLVSIVVFMRSNNQLIYQWDFYYDLSRQTVTLPITTVTIFGKVNSVPRLSFNFNFPYNCLVSTIYELVKNITRDMQRHVNFITWIFSTYSQLFHLCLTSVQKFFRTRLSLVFLIPLS